MLEPGSPASLSQSPRPPLQWRRLEARRTPQLYRLTAASPQMSAAKRGIIQLQLRAQQAAGSCVDSIPQSITHLKRHYLPRLNRYRLTSLRIPPSPIFLLFDLKFPKPRDLDAVT